MHRFSGLELRSVSINTLVQFTVRIIGSLATLVTTLLITYFLGLETFGSFTKVVAFVSGFYLLVDFGFNSIFLKQYFKNIESHLGNLVALRLIITIILLPVIFALSIALPYNELAGTGFSESEKTGILIFSLTLIALALNNTLNAFLQRNLKYGLTVFPSIVANLILITVVVLAVISSNFNLLFASYIISGLTQAVLTYYEIKKNYEFRLDIAKLKNFSKNLILTTWPLGIMLLLNFLYTRADVLLLSFFKPTTDVGTYGISYRFFEVSLALPTFLANSTYPLLLKHMSDNKKYLNIFKRYFRLYLFLSFAATALMLLGSPLINMLGDSFSKSVLPLQLLSLSLPFFFMTSLLQWHFLIREKLTLLVPLYAFALILNVVLNIIYIPTFSYFAAAVITGLSEALVFLIMLWYFVRTIKRK